MKYISTRGSDTGAGFSDVLLEGLAPDGGLYLPETWPTFSAAQISSFSQKSYADVAFEVLAPFVGDDIAPVRLSQICRAAYEKFGHPAVAPLVQLDTDQWLLELFHGPTLAFKDVAMQLLGLLFEEVLEARDQRVTIVGATSGDTGGAAIEALKGLERVNACILHPEGRVSEVQRRMMTSVNEGNIHNIAVQGTFDDCQTLVKSMFADRAFADEISLGAVNSINWARIVAQSVYYFTSAVALGAPERTVSYVVPTGNFGDIFAGYVASRMGLPIDSFCVATNSNDILVRTLSTGRYEPHDARATISPSMDIQISSNFERLIFEASGRDADYVCQIMAELKTAGGFNLSGNVLAGIQENFSAYSADEAETQSMMKGVLASAGELVDPHTAVGLVATKKAIISRALSGGVVTLSTAHPAKFPDATITATGVEPPLPARFHDLYDRPEKFVSLPNDLRSIQEHVRAVV